MPGTFQKCSFIMSRAKTLSRLRGSTMQTFLHRQLHDAPTRGKFRYKLSQFSRPPSDSSTYLQLNNAIQECALQGDLKKTEAIHCLLIKNTVADVVVEIWNKLLFLYVQLARFRSACQVFDEMSQRNVVSYNTLISASVRSCDVDRAVCLYTEMRGVAIHPNHITLASLIRAMNRGDVFHAHVVQCGLGWNEFVGSSLVERYARERRLADAMRAFGEITERDLVSWNIMIDGCASNNSKDALRVFSQMMNENAGFDGFTLTSVIKTFSKPVDLCCGMCLHGVAIRSGFDSETPINNALITMYSKCEKVMSSVKKIFKSIASPNIVSWTAIISGLMQNKHDLEASEVYKEMLGSGVRENHFVFSSVLPIYGNLADYRKGKQVHARIAKSCFSEDISVNNALIDMYSKCGSLLDAHLVFSMMNDHDVVSYTTMITCFGQHGKGREALSMLRSMAKEGQKPDDITFLGCLSACSHSGLLDEGIEIFRMMVCVYHLKPRKEHYSCIIDMLGRAGRLKEAEMFIEEMGICSDVTVWETVLGACSIHGERELGEKSAKRLMELQPRKHQSFVLLANMYAERDLWEDKGEIREKLTGDGFQKEVGSSRVV